MTNLLERFTQRLRDADIADAEGEARALLATALGKDGAAIATISEAGLDDATRQKLQIYLSQRAAHVPLGRIFGEVCYRGLKIGLAEGAFEPSLETEPLIEHAHAALAGRGACRVLDLCCGVGTHLLVLLNEIPHASGVGMDINPQAIRQAAVNADTLRLAARAEFRCGDWLVPLAGVERFDLVIANPPFVPSDAIARLRPEVREHDPHDALDGGQDGLDFYRRLSSDLDRVLAEGGVAVIQVIARFIMPVSHIFAGRGYRTEILFAANGMPAGMAISARQPRGRFGWTWLAGLIKR